MGFINAAANKLFDNHSGYIYIKLTAMKLSHFISAAAIAAVSIPLSGCGALLTTDTYLSTPDYYGVGLSTDWYPPLAGAPLLSPVYWGNQIYPGSVLPPAAPVPPGSSINPPMNRPAGNVRPSASRPVTLPDNVPVPAGGNSSIMPSHPIGNPNGGEPGVVMPPSGSGLRPGRH